MDYYQELQEKLNSVEYFTDFLDRISEFEPVRPVRPSKPRLSDETTPAAVRYANALERYDADYIAYNEHLSVYQADVRALHNAVYKIIEEYSGLDSIPEAYRKKATAFAYQRAEGFKEYYYELLDVVELFSV